MTKQTNTNKNVENKSFGARLTGGLLAAPKSNKFVKNKQIYSTEQTNIFDETDKYKQGKHSARKPPKLIILVICKTSLQAPRCAI